MEKQQQRAQGGRHGWQQERQEPDGSDSTSQSDATPRDGDEEEQTATRRMDEQREKERLLELQSPEYKSLKMQVRVPRLLMVLSVHVWAGPRDARQMKRICP